MKKTKSKINAAMSFAGLSQMPTDGINDIRMRPIDTTTGKKGFIVNVPVPTKKEPWATKEIYANSHSAAFKILKGKK